MFILTLEDIAPLCSRAIRRLVFFGLCLQEPLFGHLDQGLPFKLTTQACCRIAVHEGARSIWSMLRLRLFSCRRIVFRKYGWAELMQKTSFSSALWHSVLLGGLEDFKIIRCTYYLYTFFYCLDHLYIFCIIQYLHQGLDSQVSKSSSLISSCRMVVWVHPLCIKLQKDASSRICRHCTSKNVCPQILGGAEWSDEAYGGSSESKSALGCQVWMVLFD